MTQWPIVRLGDVMRSTELRDPARSAAEEFVYVDIASVDNRSKSIVGAKRMLGKEAPSRARKVIRRDDVLVSTVRPNLNAVALVPSELDMEICSTGFAVLRPSEKITSRFLFAFVRSPIFIDQLLLKIKGANYPAVSESDVKRVHVPLPPLAKQEQIVNLLDEADELRKLRTQADKRMIDLIPALFNEMFGDPMANPNKWPKITLGEACRKLTDGTHFSPPPAETGIPYITAKHLREYGLDFDRDPTYVSPEHHREIYARCDPKLGDILYIKDGVTTGLAAINRYKFEFSMLSSLALMRPDPTKCESEFLCAWLNDAAVKASMLGQMSGAAIRRLTLVKLKKAPILLPPLALQKEFAQRLAEIREVEEGQAASRQRLDDLFQSMLHRAFSGGL